MNDKTHDANSLNLVTRLTENVTATQEEDSGTRWHRMKAMVGRLFSGPSGRETEEQKSSVNRNLHQMMPLHASQNQALPPGSGAQPDPMQE